MLGSPIAQAVRHPVFDRAILWALAAAFLPLSRAWAAASVAEGSLDRFFAELPLERPPAVIPRGLSRALLRTSALAAASAEAERRWRELFFAVRPPSPASLVAAEIERRRASHAFMLARLSFMGLRLRTALPAVRMAVPSPRELDDEFGPLMARPDDAYAVTPDPAAVKRSHKIAGPFGIEYWLRFPSPSGDTAWAHVFEPEGVPNPPTVIYCHGICMEMESVEGMEIEPAILNPLGVRLVRLEAPWHNRRRLPGTYGGEPFLATLPAGPLRFFPAAVREIATAVAWARAAGSGPVTVLGVSLGALTAQLALCHARNWPAAARPDRGLLITTTGDVASLGFDSSLTIRLGLARELARAGWARGDVERMRPLLDPGPPAIDPGQVFVVLGDGDTVTPYDGGRRLVAAWRIPEPNCIVTHRGHFTAALGAMGGRPRFDWLRRVLVP